MKVITIPNAVRCLIDVRGMTPVAAWRTHLGISQIDMADRLGVTIGQYQKIDRSDWLHRTTLERIADEMNIELGQLLE